MLLQWLGAIPEAQFDRQRGLAYLHGQALIISTQYERCDAYLRRAEQQLRASL